MISYKFKINICEIFMITTDKKEFYLTQIFYIIYVNILYNYNYITYLYN